MMERVSSKWMATVASMWIQCSSGANTFGVYSSVLKSTQGYDQSTLETVAIFGDIGSVGGVLAGLLYTTVTSSSNHSGFGGPWVVSPCRSNPEFLRLFSNVGFCRGVNPTASGDSDVSLHVLVHSIYAVL